MISSFLFINKLISFKGESYNWKSFFLKRIFRLVTSHIFITLTIIIVVFIESNWTLNTGYILLTKSIIQWFGFGTVGLSEINGFGASIINAGVLWSLKYEWLLYFSLPIVSIIILKSKPKIFILVASLLPIIIALHCNNYYFEHLLSFLGGAIAPIISKLRKKELNYNNR